MTEARARARRQQALEELCGGTLRALAADRALHLRAGRFMQGERPLRPYAAHLLAAAESAAADDVRGAADAMALRLVHSDDAQHHARRPTDALGGALFDLLEQLRAESQVGERWPGVRANVRARFERWSSDFLMSRSMETARGRLVFTLAQVCRARVCGEPMIEAAEDPIETTRGRLVPHIGPALAALRGARGDQAAYADAALALIDAVRSLWPRDDEEPGARDAASAADDLPGLLLWTDADAEGADAPPAAPPGRARTAPEGVAAYRVFTTAHDRELRPATQVRAAQLGAFRERLDERVAAAGLNIGRLTRALAALLARPQEDGWLDEQEDGRIDGRRLARLIASPAERRLFRQPRTVARAQALVTLLVDCSGSMKAQVEALAVLVDVLLRALDGAGVETELLGFSTGAWNGGRAARDWQRAGAPPQPGRLNERLHLVFKDADTPWRRARRDIAALFKTELFREGIDGEALQWAAARLLARPAARRILLVVSDGGPMDAATVRANEPGLLDRHLREVVRGLEVQGRIEVAGLGTGLDLGAYYTRSLAIDLGEPPTQRLFIELLSLLAGRHRR